MNDQQQDQTMNNEARVADAAASGIPPMTAVESSQMSQIGYHPSSKRAFIRFHSRTPGKNGSLYSYDNVSQEQYDAFAAAESKGRWFDQNLKHATEAHPYRRVAEHD